MAGGSAGNRSHRLITRRRAEDRMLEQPRLQRWNEASLYCATLRSSLQGGRSGSGVKGQDERQKTAPLTPLPPRTGLVSTFLTLTEPSSL